MGKRLLSFWLILALLLGLAGTLCGCGDNSAKEAEDEIGEEEKKLTRGEWIIGLGSTFGMNDFETENPFFEDVKEDEELFPFVQSCAEWGVFSETGGNFQPEKEATREFAVQTAVIAAEAVAGTEGEDIYKQCISYGLEQGILESQEEDYLQETLDYQEAQSILDWALEQYNNREFVEYENVELQEDVVDFSGYGQEIRMQGAQTVIPQKLQEGLEVGDVFIAPATPEEPAGIARKITEIETDEQGNLLVTTQEPSLEEVYAALDFAAHIVPDVENIIVSEGVTLSSVERDSAVVYAGNTQGDKGSDDYTIQQLAMGEREKSSPSFSYEIEITKGQVKLNSEWETAFGKFKADLEEKNEEGENNVKEAGELFEKSNVLYKSTDDGKERGIQKIDNKFTGGYEITGSITLSDLWADVEVNPKKVFGVPVGIENILVRVNYEAETELALKGELKEKLKMMTIPVPIGATGVTVSIEVYVYADANGELKVECVTENTTSFSYQGGKIKKTSESNANSTNVEGGIDIEAGAGVTAKLKCFSIPITDVGVKGGVKFSFSTSLSKKEETKEENGEILTVESYQWEGGLTRTLPVITLSVGVEPSSLLKLNMSWELVGENGLKKVEPLEIFHWKLTISNEIVDTAPIEGESDGASEKETEETQKQEETGGILGDSEILDISQYTLSVGKGEVQAITVTSLPEGYTEADLQWSSDNEEVAVVSNGLVTGVGAGSATITVSTKDGAYEIACTVIVSLEEEVEFHSL